MFSKFSQTKGSAFVAKKQLVHTAISQRMITWHAIVRNNSGHQDKKKLNTHNQSISLNTWCN